MNSASASAPETAVPGRFVLVTGASTGIGEATARLLASRGWNVIATVRSDADADRIGAIERCSPAHFDLGLGAERAVGELADQVNDLVGDAGLAGLVNNAGYVEGGPFETVTLDRWRSQFEVNVFGVVELTRVLMPTLRRAVDPRVVVVGSISGRVGAPMLGPYVASKHAVDGLCKCLRREFDGNGPSVTLVEPGAVSTPLWRKAAQLADRVEDGLDHEQRDRYSRLIRAQRIALQDGQREGVSAELVAEVIENALTSSRPRARYLVGRDAKAGGLLDRVLPDSAMEAIGRRLIARAVDRGVR